MDHIVRSGYLDRMTSADLVARGLSPSDDLRARYAAALQPMTPQEEAIVARLRGHLAALLRAHWRRASNVEYQVEKTLGIENEFPHTHGSCIFLPQRLFVQPFDRLFKTFVHEFVHVYQRTRPIDTNALLNAWGFKPAALRERCVRDHNLRLNPDVNDIIYKDAKGHVELMVYNSDTPKSLLDAHNVVIEFDSSVRIGAADSRKEHPYELMAYTLADVLVDGIVDSECETWLRL